MCKASRSAQESRAEGQGCRQAHPVTGELLPGAMPAHQTKVSSFQGVSLENPCVCNTWHGGRRQAGERVMLNVRERRGDEQACV